jgi:hypothetical protein
MDCRTSGQFVRVSLEVARRQVKRYLFSQELVCVVLEI